MSAGLILMTYTKAIRRIEASGNKVPRDTALMADLLIIDYEKARMELEYIKQKLAIMVEARDYYIALENKKNSFKPNTVSDEIKHGSLIAQCDSAKKKFMELINAGYTVTAYKEIEEHCRALYKDIANLAPAKAVFLTRI